MGWMEFVVAMKWPFLIVLIIAVLAGVLLPEKRRKPVREWLKDIAHRDVQATAGPLSLAWGAATDDFQNKLDEAVHGEMAATLPPIRGGVEGHVEPSEQPGPPPLSREGVERMIRYSAEYGWNMSQLGFPDPPEPEITWDDEGNVTVSFDTSGVALDRALREAWRRRGEERHRDA
ncbi:hypothetical protein J7E95_39700 [Streptomyces sp. ISL-14]|nr:hypothetical protein [Streptomyces sp. ISL-14]